MSADFAAAKWRKSSRSNSEQECVEVAQVPAAFGIRDSKNPEGGRLTLDRGAFSGLLDRVKRETWTSDQAHDGPGGYDRRGRRALGCGKPWPDPARQGPA